MGIHKDTIFTDPRRGTTVLFKTTKEGRRGGKGGGEGVRERKKSEERRGEERGRGRVKGEIGERGGME